MNGILKQDFDSIGHNFANEFSIMRGTKILITGAGGMISTYLGMLLLYYAVEYDLQIYLHCRNIEKCERIYRSFGSSRMHILKFDLMEEIISEDRYDYIIHAASLASTYYFKNMPVEVMQPNVIGTWNILKYAESMGSEVIFLSSNSIYGEGGIEKSLLAENDYGIVDPLNERACYIESKRCAEQMCVAFAREYSVKTNIVRICHTYGPTFDIENDKRLIPRTIKKIVDGENIEIYNDPDSIVQYTYVGDIASAILCVMVNGQSGQAYNACSDEMVSVADAIKYMILADERGKVHLNEVPIDEKYAFSKGYGINLIKLNNSKIRNIGWKSLYKNKDGFLRTVKSYLND